MTAASPGAGRWLFGRAPDLFLGCGLGYWVIFLGLAFAGPEIRAAQPTFTLPLAILLFSMPHYGGTLLRVYEERTDRRAYTIFSVWATLAVFGAFLVGVHNVYTGAILATIYLTWSPWHYTGQNYGIALMFLRRRGVDVTPDLKRWIYGSFILCFVLAFLVLHASLEAGYNAFSYEGSQVVFLPLGIPAPLATPAIVGVGGIYLFVTLGALVKLLRRGSLRDVTPALALFGTQALWFAAPGAVRYFGWHTGVEPLDQNTAILDYTLWIFVAHGVQYLWITTYYAHATQRWNGTLHYLGKALLTGVAIWTLPFLLLTADGLGRFSFDGGMSLVVASAVNIHHFILDGAIWKLRNTRIANILIRDEASDREPVAAASGRGRRGVWAIASFGVVVALFEFWEVQVAYPRAVERSDWEAASRVLDRLAWVGYDRGNRRREVATGLARRGDLEGATVQFERSLHLRPWGETWRELAWTQYQQGDFDTAIGSYERALAAGAESSDLAHMGLGRIARERGNCQASIGHFRKALTLKPRSPARATDLAWALATCDDASQRNPAQSVALARAVLESLPEPSSRVLDTLAAGYAAAGHFDDAVQAASRALEIASANNENTRAADIRGRLGLYRSGLPYVDRLPAEGS